MNFAALDSSAHLFQVGAEHCQPYASPLVARTEVNYNTEVLNDV